MLNLNEWLGSKKTKDMLVGLVVLGAILLLVSLLAKGDHEKISALLIAFMPILVPMGALVGITIGGQALADIGREKPHETAAKVEVAKISAAETKSRENASKDLLKAAEVQRDAGVEKS